MRAQGESDPDAAIDARRPLFSVLSHVRRRARPRNADVEQSAAEAREGTQRSAIGKPRREFEQQKALRNARGAVRRFDARARSQTRDRRPQLEPACDAKPEP